ncbi:MAG: hypothetical protein JSU00_11870 [Acidobacteria bacterium]|nr:hypothetical protein [Acidobacteriota bacterium]
MCGAPSNACDTEALAWRDLNFFHHPTYLNARTQGWSVPGAVSIAWPCPGPEPAPASPCCLKPSCSNTSRRCASAMPHA